MTLVSHVYLKLHQMDVKITFLNGEIDQTIYIVQSENFVSGDANKMMLCMQIKEIHFKFHKVII